MPNARKNKQGLTRKQKAFADYLINNPKASATQAATQTYDIKGKSNVAEVIASQNLSRPSIQLYLDEHIQKAKEKIVTLVDSQKDEIALKASESILNRELGTPVARQEVRSTRINISLGLTDKE